jgi:glucosamine--fructose-6-phosphate aminotransferase (isomerizing)
MCGIVGAISRRNVVPILLDGLHRLEYRGYDSAGIAVITKEQTLARVRCVGKVAALEASIPDDFIGHVGIAHTRWATHGVPSEKNAHPHICGQRIALVHNGIVDNHLELRTKIQESISLQSETDSEVLAALIYQLVITGKPLLEAVQKVVTQIEGTYAICVLDLNDPAHMVVAKSGSPVAIGQGIEEYFVASDPLALHKVSQDFMYLEDQDVASITADGVKIYDFRGKTVNRDVHSKILHVEAAEKGKYRHFMQKEIFEQPAAVASTLAGRINNDKILEQAFGRDASQIFDKTKHILILACGTSYYSGLVAKFWLESIAKISCSVEIASEFRYKARIVPAATLVVAISQSGETADTISALKNLQQDPLGTYVGKLAICNVAESTVVRMSDLVWLTHAGPEIGVASTKGFMTQLTSLLILTLVFARRSGTSLPEIAKMLNILQSLPQIIEHFLKLENKIIEIAKIFTSKVATLFLGRNTMYPIALEGALKLKEIAYINASAYPAGELKHGPLALVDKNMPVIVLAPNNFLIDKIHSNINEVKTRGGILVVFTPKSSKIKEADNVIVIHTPEVDDLLSPMAFTIPLQLLAYYVALAKGTDVDQPRNLAKSVTVE